MIIIIKFFFYTLALFDFKKINKQMFVDDFLGAASVLTMICVTALVFAFDFVLLLFRSSFVFVFISGFSLISFLVFSFMQRYYYSLIWNFNETKEKNLVSGSFFNEFKKAYSLGWKGVSPIRYPRNENFTSTVHNLIVRKANIFLYLSWFFYFLLILFLSWFGIK